MVDLLDQAVDWLLEKEFERYQRGYGFPPKLIGRVESHVVMADIDADRGEPILNVYCGPDVIEWFKKSNDPEWIARTYEGDAEDFDGYIELEPPHCGTIENPSCGIRAHPCFLEKRDGAEGQGNLSGKGVGA